MSSAVLPPRAPATSGEVITLRGRKVVGGVAEGEALVTRQTISGWGGVNAMTGTIIETRHELRGVSFKDTVLAYNQNFVPGGNWLVPTSVLTARTAKITVQYDF